eukprot:scaffold115525_cov17-Tisochrysis_lutea.AAC.5
MENPVRLEIVPSLQGYNAVPGSAAGACGASKAKSACSAACASSASSVCRSCERLLNERWLWLEVLREEDACKGHHGMITNELLQSQPRNSLLHFHCLHAECGKAAYQSSLLMWDRPLALQ